MLARWLGPPLPLHTARLLRLARDYSGAGDTSFLPQIVDPTGEAPAGVEAVRSLAEVPARVEAILRE